MSADGRSDWSVVLLDIEGTTTPITFVHQTLFPYARRRLAAFVSAHAEDAEIVSAVAALRREHAADVAAGVGPPVLVDGDSDELVRYLEWLMDRDRKSPGLKTLQGLIWEEGYVRGELHGVVFEEVPNALRAWRASGKRVAIYSSGSVLAQRRLFQTALAGDLTMLIDQFFDTTVGPKVEWASYQRIAASLGVPTAQILFVSDVTTELKAARLAGCQVRLSIRPGNAAQPDADAYMSTPSLSAI